MPPRSSSSGLEAGGSSCGGRSSRPEVHCVVERGLATVRGARRCTRGLNAAPERACTAPESSPPCQRAHHRAREIVAASESSPPRQRSPRRAREFAAEPESSSQRHGARRRTRELVAALESLSPHQRACRRTRELVATLVAAPESSSPRSSPQQLVCRCIKEHIAGPESS